MPRLVTRIVIVETPPDSPDFTDDEGQAFFDYIDPQIDKAIQLAVELIISAANEIPLAKIARVRVTD